MVNICERVSFFCSMIPDIVSLDRSSMGGVAFSNHRAVSGAVKRSGKGASQHAHQLAALTSSCRVALKSETRRFRHRVLPLIARFGCHGAFASRPPLCNVTNCGKQTWHRSPTLLLSTEGNRVFAIIFHRHLQHKSLTPVSGLRAKISELRAKSHI